MKNELPENRSLTSRVIAAGSWTMGGFVLGQVCRLASNLVMTRLLVPEMFGIMALCQVFLYIMTLVSDIGIGQNIIRSVRGEDPRFLNTAWTVQIIRGFFITGLVLLAALTIKIAASNGWFSDNSAYTTPELPLIIAVMSLSTLISGFSSTNIMLAARKLLLSRLTTLELVSQIFGITVMIWWAYAIERSIWALVIGAISTTSLYTILSHTSFPGSKNKLGWDKSAFWEIFHFGKWLLLSSIITAVLAQGDRLILGNLLTAEMLGIYSIAFFLAAAATQAIAKLNSMVFFPLFSEINREKADKMSQIYYKVRRGSDSFAMISAGFLFVSAELIVEVLFDDRYLQAGWMLSILSFSLLLTGPIVSKALYFSINKPKYVSLMSAVMTVTLFCGLPLTFHYGGLEWGIWILALYSVSVIPLDLYYKKKLGILNFRNEFRMLPTVLIGYALGLIFNELVSYLL